MKNKNMVAWAMYYHKIVILVVCCLVAFGICGLPKMRKNEFPDFKVRQGVVVAVAPGNTSEEMAEQVAKPLENYIFTYKEVKKEKCYSMSRDGIVYVMVELNDELSETGDFWNKFKHGIDKFQRQLPSNVAAIMVNDDFGDTSALLITMESQQKTYRELSEYMDELQDRLRAIKSVGRLSVSGMQQEQIAVTLDNGRLAKYGLSDLAVAQILQQKGLTSAGGSVKSDTYTMPVHVGKSLNSVFDIGQQIVYTSPTGTNIRLKDIATVRREYPQAESRIESNGKKCLLLSVEMKKGQNVVQMGNDINAVMADFQQTLPEEVSMYRITDQSKVVGDSVYNFLHELIIAIVAVVIVVMLLLPMRVALVAASTIPITIFTSLGLYYAFGIELNTVTLAALIVTLGMIVDDCIIIIDNYLEQIGQGKDRWQASIDSATHFFKSVFTATLAISITFFPFIIVCTGQIYDFVFTFPWAISIVLAVSLAVATMLIPFMQYWFIKPHPQPLPNREGSEMLQDSCTEQTENHGKEVITPLPIGEGSGERLSHGDSGERLFLRVLQRWYDRLLTLCMKWPKTALAIGLVAVCMGPVMLKNHPLQMMPVAERDQLAVEMTLPTGTAFEKTSLLADSVEHLLRQDRRVVSVTSFKGCSSPRFHTAYAPQIVTGPNYVQFIVNTTDEKATEGVLDDYADRLAGMFPEAFVKFKQLSYSPSANPIEVRLSGGSEDELLAEAEKVKAVLLAMPGLKLVRTDCYEPQTSPTVMLKEDEASRLGVGNAAVERMLAMRYGSGIAVASVWEADKEVPVVVKSTQADRSTTDDLMDEQIDVMNGHGTVPLRQVATLEPSIRYGQIVRRNGVPTISVIADLNRGQNMLDVTAVVKEKMADAHLKPTTTVTYGGEQETTDDNLPFVLFALGVAAVMIFFILISHFKRLSLSLLIFASIFLSLFGASIGLIVMGRDFSVTAILGLVCLMGIIVRNGIIMYDYAEELRRDEGMSVRDGIWHSASRRMRPIFLTSAAASMGVVPMLLGGSSLWTPMGGVICFGTLITMCFILTVLPTAYLVVFNDEKKKRNE